MKKIMKFDDFVNESLNIETSKNIYSMFFVMMNIIDRKESKYHVTGGPMIDEDKLPDEDDLQKWMDYADSEGDTGYIRFKIMDADDGALDEIKEKYLNYIPDISYGDEDPSVFSIATKSFLTNFDDIRECFSWMTL